MSLNTYLTFNGNCREAFEFYRSVFGGDYPFLQTFGDAPPEMGVPDAEKDLIMHVSLPVGSSVLMGSDSCSAFGPPAEIGNNFAISIVAESLPSPSSRRGGKVPAPSAPATSTMAASKAASVSASAPATTRRTFSFRSGFR